MNETKRSRHIKRMMNNESQKKIENLSQSNPVCFRCGKVDHYKKDRKVKKKINNLNILEDLKDMLCKVMLNSLELESRTGSDNENDTNQLLDIDEDNSSQTSSDLEECIKGSCDCHPKTINVIIQEQELVLDVLRKIKDETIKQEFYEVFKKSVHKPKIKKTMSPYNLNEILTRFNQNYPKDIIIKDLQEEIRQYKKEIQDLRQFTSLGLTDLQDQINKIVVNQ